MELTALMEWLLALFIFGSPIFWGAFIILSFVLFWEVDEGEHVFKGIFFIFFILLLNVSGVISMKDWLIINFIIIIPVYVFLGVICAYYKWYAFLEEKLEQYKLNKASHICIQDPPTAASNKSKIISWISYWPWVVVWTLLNDPVKYVYRKIYNSFENMADNKFKDV